MSTERIKIGHRPTKFRPEMEEEIKVWLDDQIDQYMRTQDGKHERLKVKFPTLAALCLHLDICAQTLQDWQNDSDPAKDGLRHQVKRVKLTQVERLVNNGLSGEYKANQAMFLLSANHGYAPMSKTETKGEIDMKQTIKKYEFVTMEEPKKETNE